MSNRFNYLLSSIYDYIIILVNSSHKYLVHFTRLITGRIYNIVKMTLLLDTSIEQKMSNMIGVPPHICGLSAKVYRYIYVAHGICPLKKKKL